MVAGEGAWLVADRAQPSATGAGLLGRQGLGLQLQEGAEGALGQAAGGGSGDLLEGEQIDVEARAAVPEGTPGHNLPPPGGQVVDFLEVLGG